MTDPTVPPPQPESLNSALQRNIAALERRRREDAARASLEERVAEAITRFTGSMAFVYLNLALVGFWISANLGLIPGVPAFDEDFIILAMIASVAAIFRGVAPEAVLGAIDSTERKPRGDL